MLRTKIYCGNSIRGDNSKTKVDRVMVLNHCTSPGCHLFIFQVSSKSIEYFWRYAPDKGGRKDGRTESGRTDGRKDGMTETITISPSEDSAGDNK